MLWSSAYLNEIFTWIRCIIDWNTYLNQVKNQMEYSVGSSVQLCQIFTWIKYVIESSAYFNQILTWDKNSTESSTHDWIYDLNIHLI